MTAMTRTTPHFNIGDAVLVDARAVQGHCRTPLYLRGRNGVIADILGSYRNPEQLAYRSPGLPEQILYKVRFRQSDALAALSGAADRHARRRSLRTLAETRGKS